MVNQTKNRMGDDLIVKRALESYKHFEKFEECIREAWRELHLSRDLQKIDGKLTHLPEYENEAVYDIYDHINEIQQIIKELKEGDPET